MPRQINQAFHKADNGEEGRTSNNFLIVRASYSTKARLQREHLEVSPPETRTQVIEVSGVKKDGPCQFVGDSQEHGAIDHVVDLFQHRCLSRVFRRECLKLLTLVPQ